MKIHSVAGFAGAMLVMGFLGGCASYMTPGGGVSIPEITTPNVADAMSRQPAAVFPARLAVVRVQGAGYESYSNRGYGRGRYSVITNRDIETSFPGLRFFEVEQGGARTPLNMFWNDTLVQANDVVMDPPTNAVGLATSGANGLSSGNFADATQANINAHSWGDFSANSKGNNAFIDTFGDEYVRLAVDLGVARDRIATVAGFEAGRDLGVKVTGSAAASRTEVLAEMADLVASGRITVPIAAVYPLDRVQAAYAELEEGHTRGKIVLLP